MTKTCKLCEWTTDKVEAVDDELDLCPACKERLGDRV